MSVEIELVSDEERARLATRSLKDGEVRHGTAEDWIALCFCGASWQYRWRRNCEMAILGHWKNEGGYKQHLVDHCYGVSDERR